MPPRINNLVTEGGQGYQNPFNGPVDHTGTVNVDVTALTDDEVDAFGYLKPGVPFDVAGALVGAAVPVHGVTIEAIKVADSNSAADLAAASASHPVAVGVIGTVVRDRAEYNLGRAYTAAEIAGFGLAGSTLKLLD